MSPKLVAALVLLCGCGGIGDAQQRLRTAIDAKRKSLDKCYTKSLARDAEGQGKMKVVLHVTDSDGVIDSVKVTSSEVTDPKLETCVKAALTGIQMSPAPDSSLEVAYTLVFTPDS